MSQILGALSSGHASRDEAPSGCGWSEDGDVDIVRASLRSVSGAITAAAVGLFWNGILCFFVYSAAAALYGHLVGPLPAWLPVASPRGGNNGPAMSVGLATFILFFMIPFAIIGVALIHATLERLCGQLEVRLWGNRGEVRTTAGPFAWSQPFDASRVRLVDEVLTKDRPDGETHRSIGIHADGFVEFGCQLTDDRRAWMIRTLRTLLIDPGAKG